jgi:hypothetical protein
VAGLPDAAEGRHIQLSIVTTSTPAPATAAAVCRAGVADFHRQVLLLHCAPVNTIHAVTVTMLLGTATACNDHQHPAAAAPVVIASVNVDLVEQLCRPSPSVLSFVLGVSGSRRTRTTTTATAAAASAVLSLTLHHRLLVITTTRTGCSSLLRSCLRVPLAAGCCPPVLRTTTTKQNHRQHHQGPAEAATADDDGGDDDGDSSSSGFITIEKGTISRRRPPSDYLLTTTDDNEVEGSKRPPGPGPAATATNCGWSLSSLDDDTKVENDFLAMLMLQEDHDDDHHDLVDQLDALIKDAEADLAAIWPSRR